jgi:hypothetical protein
MVRDYFITGIPRLKLYIEANLVRGFGFVLPTILITIELIFITDMVGATSILTKYLNGNAAAVQASATSSVGNIK